MLLTGDDVLPTCAGSPALVRPFRRGGRIANLRPGLSPCDRLSLRRGIILQAPPVFVNGLGLFLDMPLWFSREHNFPRRRVSAVAPGPGLIRPPARWSDIPRPTTALPIQKPCMLYPGAQGHAAIRSTTTPQPKPFSYLSEPVCQGDQQAAHPNPQYERAASTRSPPHDDAPSRRSKTSGAPTPR